MSKLSDRILGTDERMRPRTAYALLVDGIYVFWLMACLAEWRLGLLEGHRFADMAIFIVVPRLFFYPLCRSGITMKLADAGLTQLQMIHASLAIVWLYAILPDARAALMQCLCLAQVFGLFSLRPRQAVLMGLIGVMAMFGLLVIASIWPLPNFDMALETPRLIMSGFVIMLLALLSRRYALIRVKVRERKQELARAVAQVNELITHDPLTGLHNRQYMQEVLERERARLTRGGTSFCVALIDLDHFKDVNDMHGHHVGDDVLVSFANATRQILRTTDLASRWGGEEFLILMPDTEPGQHGVVAMERLRQSLETLQVSASAPELRVSCSAGVAGCHGGETTTQVLERADRALYAAKAAGRKRCVLADPALASTTPPSPAAPHAQRDAAHVAAAGAGPRGSHGATA